MTVMIGSQAPNPGDHSCPLDISSFGCSNSLMKLVTPKKKKKRSNLEFCGWKRKIEFFQKRKVFPKDCVECIEGI